MKIKNLISSETKWRLLNILSRPLQQYLFLPYQPDAHCFVIPRVSHDHQGVCEHGLPIPPGRLWSMSPEKNTVEQYLDLGKRNIEKMREILRDAGVTLTQESRILDFGCGTGRTLRWLNDIAGTSEVWGVDIRSEHIIWCKHHLAPPFRFFTSTGIPHLPFEDGYFDLIYAFSVFTHIDDLADMWLMELRRIMKKDGTLYITIHDKHTLDMLRKTDPQWISGEPFESYAASDFGMIAKNRGAKSNVFYDLQYLRRNLEPTFEIIAAVEEAYVWQTGLVLKKK